jgi:TolA-binding protein
VIKRHADSRYAPLAFVAKAQALVDRDDKAAAKGVATQLGSYLQDKGLAGRWELEQRYWAAVTSGETGKKLQDALAAVSSAAGEYPSVYAQAEVAIAESLLAGGKADEAEKIFRSVSNAAQATSRTMAAAWTGLGDCLWGKADKASGDDKNALLREAITAYMRPVVMYPNQGAYVARAAFYAGRSFQMIGGDESRDRARRLYREVIFKFPGTRWDREAREALRGL